MCLVERTCTEILENGSSDAGNSSRALAEFRQLPAYVLLGDPGAGKTTVFKQQADKPGACYVTARDLITFDERPEWRNTILFIDGLDEVRAGSTDARTPFDAIRERLNQLGRPRFRLSCREADWLGATDGNHLTSVSPNETLIVLHLDQLTTDKILEILNHNRDVPNADEFMRHAKQRGLNDLLINPQVLNMLVKATAGGNWPDTRKQTFGLACQRIVAEHNTEHQCATRLQHIDEVQQMDAAGFLCAVQLSAGNAGYTLRTDLATNDFPYLNDARYEPASTESADIKVIHDVVRTKLFKSLPVGKIEPVHRQVAEYLAARYLAKRVNDGLPIGRVLALITGEDGMVVAELRGLNAWLAALCMQHRGALIDRDPLGVVLYGDVQDFDPEDKYKILDGLRREAARFPGFRHSVARSANKTASSLGALATRDMEQKFRSILTAPDPSMTNQALVSCVLAAMTYGAKLTSLNDTLLNMIRDDTWMPLFRCNALDNFLLNIAHYDDENIKDEICKLKSLIDDIRSGVVTDPGGDLTGSLLMALYPHKIGAAEVLDYLRTTNGQDNIGFSRLFWTDALLKKSTGADVCILLDELSSRRHGLWSILDNHSKRNDFFSPKEYKFWDAVSELLLRGLNKYGDSIDPKRLYRWLGAVRRHSGCIDPQDDEIRSWLELRPELQKSIISIALESCHNDDYSTLQRCMRDARQRLFGTKSPDDLGLWYIEQLAETSNKQVARYLLEEAVNTLCKQKGHIGLTLEAINQSVEKDPEREAWLTDMLVCDVDPNELDFRNKQFLLKAKEREDIDSWRGAIKSNEARLREGFGETDLLVFSANVYFRRIRFKQPVPARLAPAERLRNFLNDDALTLSVLDGFRSSLNHEAAPGVEALVQAYAQDKTYRFCVPILAGLEELTCETTDYILQLNHEKKRLAVAVYLNSGADLEPNWYKALLRACPEVVAEVMTQFVIAALRSKKNHISGVRSLPSEEYLQVAELASLAMLESFPVRCTNVQLRSLDDLLWAALQRANNQLLSELIKKKLGKRSMNMAQQVYWLASGLMIEPGTYCEPLKKYVDSNEKRVQHLASFLYRPRRQWSMLEKLPLGAIQLLIQLTGKFYAPYTVVGDASTDATRAADLQHRLISNLSSRPQNVATDILDTLLSDPDLERWYPVLKQARFEQLAVRREASYSHPGIHQVIETLNNRSPANACDLAVLTMGILQELANTIRNGNTNDYSQYWNEEVPPKLPTHKRENACRDALLSDMRPHLAQLDIDAQPEGMYADNKRADIRVSVGGAAGFSIPIEIKKNTSPDLWHAIESQLTAKYTRDPSAGGYGIYLVFWFGAGKTKPPPEGQRPRTAQELEERLRATLSTDESRKISICVIDVAKPG